MSKPYVGKHTLSQQFNIISDKYLTTTRTKLKNNILKGLTKKLNTWEELVFNALYVDIRSVPGEVSPKSHMATKDRERFFPYMRSEKLNGSLRGSVKTRALVKPSTSKAKLTFSIRAQITSAKAKLTNDSVNSKNFAGWKGWMDDIMFKSGRGEVHTSVREIFNEFSNMRRSLAMF